MTSADARYALQASLFDDASGGVELGELGATGTRRRLTAGAWVDVRPGWLTGSDVLFTTLAETVPWKAERRQMYDRVVDVPRLVRFYGEGEPLPDPLLSTARDALSRHYRPELREDFATSGLCFYRDGSDSVAWHGDDTGRSRTEDTMVAILSLGTARPLLLRPRGGGHSIRYSLGHGDLPVMGGSCQRTWEHCVPKSTRPLGPRISVQFRTRGVR
ncbi:alpha-ketoglutarate-dependent dioxygenase AlkB [Rhodococcus sp. WS4]|nr:alpha-ketoglutarate-dependent dioxygenase AlkB [Rhodococcus sp. WS4]